MSTPPPDLVKLLRTDSFMPQRAFTFPRHSWIKWLGHIDGMTDFLNGLPQALDRIETAQVVADKLKANPEQAFTAAMIWGFGDTGYGPYRTAYILTGSRERAGQSLSVESVEKLVSSARYAQGDGPVEGYRKLNNRPGKLAGLGPAFFTKWLYFVTTDAGVNTVNTAPVLDRLIILWLKSEASVRLRPAQTSEYERYVHTLSEWGEPYGLVAADVEERIFRLIRNDAASSPARSEEQAMR